MKAKILQENISKAFLTASRFSSVKAQLPVLGNIKITTGKQKIYLHATNLENAIMIPVGADILEEGQITVPAKIAADIFYNLNPQTLEPSSHEEKLVIISDSFKGEIAGINSQDFPSIPEKAYSNPVEIDFPLLEKTLGKTLFCVSSDETRPVLTGVLFSFTKTGADVVATDGFRLSKVFWEKNTNLEGKVIIPKNILLELTRIGKGQNTVSFSYSTEENQVVFVVGDTVLSSRVISGDFPDYQKVIPTDFAIEANSDRQDFLKAIKLSGVFSREMSGIVKISVGERSLDFSSESSSLGRQESRIACQVGKMGKITIAFNPRYIEEAVSSFNGENLDLKFNDANSPGVFLDSEDSSFLHLVMPVKVS